MRHIGNSGARALIDNMADTLLQAKAERFSHTFCKVDTDGLVEMLALTVADLEIEKLGDTLGDVETAAQVATAAARLAEANSTTLCHTLVVL